MGLKNDLWIRNAARFFDLISPFEEAQVRDGVLSYGLSSYGYDIRVANEYKVFIPGTPGIVDPKKFNPILVQEYTGPECIIPPNSFALARSVERIKVPRNVLVLCIGKSTYARCGAIINVTPLEPEWEGIITLEISNTTASPLKIYSDEGIAQLLFFEGDAVCGVSYADKKGKYQSQTKIEYARVEGVNNETA